MRKLLLATLVVAPLLLNRATPRPPVEPSLAFEENRGQSPPAVHYLARGKGYGVSLGTDALTLHRPGGTLRIHPPGRPLGRPLAEGALPGRVNYLVGAQRDWHTDIPTWTRVRYRQVFPGVDLVCYGRQTRLEYDLELQPGVDPRQLCLAYSGARDLTIDGGGNLVVATDQTPLVQPPPVAYQEIGGERRPVAVRYALQEKGVGFEVAAHDPALPLTIDPLIYSSYLGGGRTDEILALAVDGSGNAYVAGGSDSTNLPTTVGAFQPTLAGTTRTDGFVAKIGANGNRVYTTYLGGSLEDVVEGLAVDASGNAYVTGFSSSTDFPLLNPLSSQPGAGFVTKLNATGSALVYSTRFAGNGTGIAVDGTGHAYVVGGTTSSNDFPVFNPFQAALKGLSDAYLTKLSPGGNTVVFSTYLGGSGGDEAQAVTLSPAGEAWVVGSTTSSDFPTKSPSQGTRGGALDAFVTRFSPAGNALVYSTYLGGSADDQARAVRLDSQQNAYVAGETESPNLPVVAAFQPTRPGNIDGFVGKLTPSGGVGYLTYLGGTGRDIAYGVAVDASGQATVVGDASSTDFPVQNAFQPNRGPFGDAFFTRLSPTGSLLDSSYLGGNGIDKAFCVAPGAAGDLFLGGVTGSTDFPTLSPFQASLAGGGADGFVTRLTVGGPGPSPGPSPGSSPQGFSASLVAGWNPVGLRAASITGVTANPVIAGVASYDSSGYVLTGLEAASLNPTTRGYFVFAQGPTTMTYMGPQPSTSGSIPLNQGWNLIALPVSGSLPGASLRTTRAGASVPLNSVLLTQFFENRPGGVQAQVDVSAGGSLVSGVTYWVFASQSGVTLSYP